MARTGLRQFSLMAPTNLLIGLFIVLPAIYVLLLSFARSSYGLSPEFVGFDNYVALFTDRYFWRATWNTFIVVNAVVYIELAAAMILAALVMGISPFWRRWVITLILLPYAVSEVVGILMVKYMFDPDLGVATHFISGLGLGQMSWTTRPGEALGLVVALSVWMHIPFTFVIIYTARLGVPRDLYEAARTDGAGPWKQFWHVTFPQLMPAILVALLFRYIFAFRIFGEVWLLTGGGPARQTEVLAVYLYKQAFSYYDFGLASATAWAMVVLALLIASPYFRITYRRMFSNVS